VSALQKEARHKQESFMEKGLRVIGIIAVAVVGFSTAGCATATGMPPTRFPAVSDYAFVTSKNHVIVGTVVLRSARQETLIADLMDLAIAKGGHDIINIRLDWREVMGRREINTATAVVIRFTEETLMYETSVTVVSADGTAHTTTQRRPVRRDEAVIDADANGSGGGRVGRPRR